MTVEWREPPPDKRGGYGEIKAIVAELKSRPGQWALVAHDVAANRAQTFRMAGCQASVRRIESGLYDIYARWPES